MPTGILDPNSGMIPGPWWSGLTVENDAEGRRIGGARVLDTGGVRNGIFDARDWTPDQLSSFAQSVGLGDLWNSGYSQTQDWSREGSTGELIDNYSPELLQALGGYDFMRLGQRAGQTDRGRQLAAVDRSTGQVAWGSDPYSYSKWTDAPLEAGAVLGSAALLGGGIPGIPGLGSLLPGAEAAGAAAGATGDIALSGLLPVETFASTSSLPGLAEIGAVGAGALGATNPALIESALGTAGYGASSAGAGGLSGGLLGNLGNLGSGAMSFLRDNPQLARLLFSAGSGLLTSMGGGSSGGAPAPAGPPRAWSSPLQQGLLQTPEQTNVATPVSFKGRW